MPTSPLPTTPGPAPDASPITTVVFDFGGVLITPITDHLAVIAERHGVTLPQLFEVLLGPHDRSTEDHPWHRAERGELAIAEIMSHLEPWATEAGIVLDGDEIDLILAAEFHLRERVVAAIAALRSAGYRTALLTNSFKEFRPILEQRVDMSVFDVIVDSSEVGVRKPDPAIYALTTERVGCAPSEVLYVDDFIGNIEGARLAGWNAVHVACEQAVLDAIATWTTVTP